MGSWWGWAAPGPNGGAPGPGPGGAVETQCQPARQAVQSQQPTFDSGNSSSSVRAPYIRPQARLRSSTPTVEEASPPTSYQRRWFRCGSGARPPLLSRVSVPHVLHQLSPSTRSCLRLLEWYNITERSLHCQTLQTTRTGRATNVRGARILPNTTNEQAERRGAHSLLHPLP